MLDQQLQVIIDFIRDYPHQYSPTIREIAKSVGIKSSATAHKRLAKLAELGYISHEPNCPRTIRLLKDAE